MADREHKEWADNRKAHKDAKKKDKPELPPPPADEGRGSGGEMSAGFDPVVGF